MKQLSEREKMVAGLPYDARDPELLEARVRAQRLTRAFAALDPGAFADQHAALTELFGGVDEGAYVVAPFHCDYGWNITLGEQAFLNAGCVLLDCAPIVVGPGSLLGPAVQLCAVTHPVDPDQRRLGVECAAPVTIGGNVWIGAGAIVGPGVTVGDDSVVGAGAVVLRDVPPRVLVAGTPARVLRRL